MSDFFPSLDHITLEDSKCVYEPSDDTYLLCDALEADMDHLMKLKPVIAMEIGSGSGCVITTFKKIFQSMMWPVTCIAVDINENATILTKRTAIENKCKVDVFESDLGKCFTKESIDVIIFNPPYVPTPPDEVGSYGIEASWAGGEDGREVIDKFIPQMNYLLSPGGSCYLLLISENKPNEIKNIIQDLGLSCKIVMKRQARNEHYTIFRFDKENR